MKYIYLDTNIIKRYIDFYICNKEEIVDLVGIINLMSNDNSVKLIYSPAHIEEIAVIQRKAKKSKLYINRNLKIISKITNNCEFKPSSDNIKVSKEHPIHCYQRVIKDYEKTTLVAENNEKEKIKKWKSIDIEITLDSIEAEKLFFEDKVRIRYLDFLKNKIDESQEFINKLNTSFIPVQKSINDKIFPMDYNTIKQKIEYHTMINIELEKILNTKIIPSYAKLKNNFQLLEAIFEITFDFLDAIGYYNDARAIKKEKYRSRMHDISHSIYGTSSHYFITNDKKFTKKLIAIYSLFEVSTKVLNEKEFISTPCIIPNITNKEAFFSHFCIIPL